MTLHQQLCLNRHLPLRPTKQSTVNDKKNFISFNIIAQDRKNRPPKRKQLAFPVNSSVDNPLADHPLDDNDDHHNDDKGMRNHGPANDTTISHNRQTVATVASRLPSPA